MKKFDKKRIIITAFFLLFLCYGLLTINDYGISVDEIYERRSSLVTYKYLVPGVSDIVTDSVDFSKVESLHEWHDRYYGVALQLPTVVIEHLFGFELPLATVLQIRHVYTFLLFFIASVCFFLISRRFTGNIWLSLLGTAVFILNPRTLADSYYNMKDSLFLSIFTINLYGIFRFMEKPNWKTMIWFGFLSALCSNTRIVGAVAAAVCVLWMLTDCALEKKKAPLKYIFGGVALCFAFYILLAPVTWVNPVGQIIATLEKFSSFPWGGSNFYMGQMIKASELPWHYLPVWMILTIPFGYLILAAFGGIKSILHPIMDWKKSYVLAVFIIPVFYAVLARPVLYNGWRHFYFLYACVVLLALIGMEWLWQLLKHIKLGKWLAIAGTVAIFLPVVFWTLKNHPYEYTYFNPGFREFADTHFEKDYWGVASYDLLEWMLNEEPKEDGIKTHMFLDWAMNKLTPEERARIEQIEAKGAEHITYNYIASSKSPIVNPYYSNDKEYSIVVDDMEIGSVFWNLWDQNSSFHIFSTKDSNKLTYTLNEMSWQKEIVESQVNITGLCGKPIATDWISLENSDESIWKDAVFSYTENGKDWITVNLQKEANIYGEFAHIHLDKIAEIKGIRLTYTEKKDTVWNINLYGKRQEENKNNSSFIEVSATNVDQPNAVLAMDNDLQTRWSVNPQAENIIFAFTMKESVLLKKIELALGEDVYDAPTHLKLYVSDDEVNWTELSYETNGVDFMFAPVKCRYVRMIQEPDAARESNWTIREIRLYGEKQ